MLRAVSLPIGELAEEHVLLDRRGGVVAPGLEERDGAGELGRELLGEDLPCLEEPRLEAVVDEIEAVAGLDQLEGQVQEPRAVLRPDIRKRARSMRVRSAWNSAKSSALMKEY